MRFLLLGGDRRTKKKKKKANKQNKTKQNKNKKDLLSTFGQYDGIKVGYSSIWCVVEPERFPLFFLLENMIFFKYSRVEC